MTDSLTDVVEVVISRETASIDTAAFNIPLILTTHTNFQERARTYTTINGLLEDFESTSNTYLMAQAMFSGDIKPPSIIVGRKQVDQVTITPVVANSAVYTVTVNGTAYSFTSDASATADEITEGLEAAITATGVNVTDNIGTLTIEPTTPGDNWSVVVSSNMVKTDGTSSETWVDALGEVESENNQWYALTAETHSEADVLTLAAAIEARRKIYGTSTQEATVPSTATTDIASKLSDLNYDRTFLVYLPTADTQFPECVWIGSQLPEVPGSNDWDLKQGSGITVSSLSETQKVNLRNKNTNFYTRKAGLEVFQDGNMVSGAPIDEIIFIDWVVARLEESVFFRMVNSKKIPFTRTGATIIESDIRGVMSQGVANGGIADDTPYTVQAPDVLAIPEVQRAQRIMGDFIIRFRLAGSVRKVIIRGSAYV